MVIEVVPKPKCPTCKQMDRCCFTTRDIEQRFKTCGNKVCNKVNIHILTNAVAAAAAAATTVVRLLSTMLITG